MSDGDWLVLGGLRERQEIKREMKVPLLGDMPVVGLFFRSKRKDVRRTRIVLLLSVEGLRSGLKQEPQLIRQLEELKAP